MITPFLIVPVAAALLWKHALYNPSYGLFNGMLRVVFGPERAAAGLDLAAAADVDHRVAGVAVDAVHDADHPGRVAGPAARRHRGGPDRRLLGVADLPLHDLPAPAPVPGARRAARLDLHRAELRRRLHDHVRRSRHGQPAVHHLPDLLQREGVRTGVGRGRDRRHRHDHHRHVRPARRVVACSGRSPDDGDADTRPGRRSRRRRRSRLRPKPSAGSCCWGSWRGSSGSSSCSRCCGWCSPRCTARPTRRRTRRRSSPR